jgi:hypothetical protein
MDVPKNDVMVGHTLRPQGQTTMYHPIAAVLDDDVGVGTVAGSLSAHVPLPL